MSSLLPPTGARIKTCLRGRGNVLRSKICGMVRQETRRPQLQLQAVRVLVASADEAPARWLLAAADDTASSGVSTS